jgi:acyl dehydratase
MGHYKLGETRAEATEGKWLPVGRQIGQMTNEWSGRSDIVAYVGRGAGGVAPACFIPASAEVEVNVDVAFGFGVEPEDIDLTTRAGRYEFPRATGAIMHEAFHAKFSQWDMKKAKDALADDEFEALVLLEEGRIEAQGLRYMPKAKPFLEACAMEIVIADAGEQFAEMSNTQAAATLVGLVWARVDGGVLRLSDVAEVTDLIDDYLGLDVVVKLRDIATKAQDHVNHWDAAGLYPLAREWARIVREVAEEKGDAKPESGEGEGEGEGASMMSEFIEAMMDALAESAENVAISNGDALEDAETAEKYEEVVKEKSEKAKEVKEAKSMASKVFSSGTAEMGAGGTYSKLSHVRPPTSGERIAATVIATKLEKAKYRDRDVTEVASVTPPGRLRARAMVQGAAMRERGIMTQPEAWRRKVRKQTDEPTLTVGVMVDISGSMGAAMEPMATTAYVLSEATNRVQGRAAMVYYGQSVFPTLRAGERMSEVKVYTAPDGTEKFDDAFRAVDGTLDLLYGDGARLLVVVSDGHYTPNESAAAKRWMRRCAEEGVAVVWLPFDDGHMAKHVAGEYGVVLSGRFDPTTVAMEIGQACEKAINTATLRKTA